MLGIIVHLLNELVLESFLMVDPLIQNTMLSSKKTILVISGGPMTAANNRITSSRI